MLALDETLALINDLSIFEVMDPKGPSSHATLDTFDIVEVLQQPSQLYLSIITQKISFFAIN